MDSVIVFLDNPADYESRVPVVPARLLNLLCIGFGLLRHPNSKIIRDSTGRAYQLGMLPPPKINHPATYLPKRTRVKTKQVSFMLCHVSPTIKTILVNLQNAPHIPPWNILLDGLLSFRRKAVKQFQKIMGSPGILPIRHQKRLEECFCGKSVEDRVAPYIANAAGLGRPLALSSLEHFGYCYD